MAGIRDIATLGFRADARELVNADRALNDLSNSGQRTEQQTNRTNAAFDRMQRMAKAVAGALAAMAVYDKIKEVTLLAARYNELGIVMDRLGRNAGISGGMLATTETALRKTGISAIQSRDAIAKLISANIDLSRATELARLAQDAAVIGGMNSSDAFASLIKGIQSAEKETLQTLGLNVNFQQSYEKLAKSIGKKVDALTEQEKTQAAVNAVMEKAPGIAGAYEDSMTNGGKALRSMSRYIEDLKVQLGQPFQNPFEDLVFAATDALKVLNDNVGTIRAVISGVIDAIGPAAKITAAYFALFVAAPVAITATWAAMTRLGHAIAVYSMNVMIGQANTIGLNTTLYGTSVAAQLAAGTLTKAALAANLLFAAFVGWEIGKYLESQFVEVAVAGEVMAGELLKQWERVKFAGKVAFDALTVFAREAVSTLTGVMAGWFDIVAKGLRAIGDDTKADAIVEYAERMRAATAVAGTLASRTGEASAEMEKQIKLIDLDTDRRSTALVVQANLVEQTKRGTAATVAAATAVTGMTDAQKKAYESAVKAAKDYITSLQNQRAELGLSADQLIALNAARAAALAPTAKLREAIMSEALALIQATEATSAAAAEKERYTAAVAAQIDTRLNESLAAQTAIDDMRREIDTYGMGAAAITRYNIAQMEKQKLGIMATGSYDQKEIDQLDALIGKQRELMNLQNMRGDLDDLLNVDKVETFGEALRGAFGEAGSALGQLGGQFQSYMEKMTKAEKERAVAKLKYGEGDKRTIKAIAKIDEQAERDRIGAYADIAGAAKGMFKEQTAGYKILQAVEQTFRAVELAGQLQSLYTHLFVTTAKATGTTAGQAVETSAVIGGEAARNAAKVPGVQMAFMSALGPWGMAAAGVAIAAVLGGAFGSSSSVNAADRADAVQKKQGTGGVFGDSDAKADSMAKSLELLEANSDMVLPLTQNMVASLQSIDASMSGLSNLVVRTAGITTGDNFGIATGVTGAALGGLWGKTKQSITDSGIQFGGSVADLQNGQGYQQYANVEKTKSSFFGLKKSSSNSLTTGALDGDLTAQFALVFKDLEKVLASSAPALGRDANEISAAVRGVELDLQKLSLMDLKGDELQAAINAVISKASDDVAQVALPGFDAFRKVGEGYATTVMRVATGIERADYELERFGITAVAYSDILNKQGDVGAEIVRQSIMAAAGMGGVADIMRTMSGSATDLAATYGDLLTAQDAMRMVGFAADSLNVGLVRSAGGLDKLQSGLDDYLEGFFSDSEKVAAQTASMGRKFADLGLTMPATSDAFRALVENTPALRGQLLLLAGGFAELMESTVDLAKTIDTRGMLVDVMRAEGRVAESVALSRTLELEETEQLLRPMQQRLWALEDERAAAQLNVRLLEAQGDTAGALALSRGLELSAMLDSERGIQTRIWALEDERAALDKALTAVQRAVEDERKAKTAANKIVMDGYDKSIERSKKAVASLKTVANMLADAVDKVGLPTEAPTAATRRDAQADLSTMAALYKAGGTLPDSKRLEKVLATLAEDSSAQFGSEAEYKLDRIKTATAVADLAGATGKALTIEERNLASLERMRTAAEDAHAADMVRLDGILETAQRQVDATKGVDVSIMSVSAAVAALGTLLGKVSQGGASAAIVGAYGSALGRAPDATGMDYWSGLAAGGVSMDAISGSIRGSTEAQEKIAALYEKVLGRPADKAGADYWKGTGLSLADIEKSLRASDEYAKLPASASTDSDSNWRKGDTPAAATAYAATTAPSSNSAASTADSQAVVEALDEHGKLMIQLLYPIAKSTKETAKTNAAMNRQQQQEVAPT